MAPLHWEGTKTHPDIDLLVIQTSGNSELLLFVPTGVLTAARTGEIPEKKINDALQNQSATEDRDILY